MSTQTINISLPEELIKDMDIHAKKEFENRSEYIRRSIIKRMRIEKSAEAHPEVLEIAKKIADKYDQDFKNLANR